MRAREFQPVSSLLGKIPERIRSRCTPEAVMLEVHGVQMGRWECPGCHRPLLSTDYPVRACPGCQRPLPRRCASSGCSDLCEPLRRGSLWYDPPTICTGCQEDTARAARLEMLRDEVPGRQLGLASQSYQRLDHRAIAEDALVEWVSLAAGQRGGPTAIYLHGNTGAGKTVAAAHATSKLVLGGVHHTLCWVREWDLLEAAKRRFADDPGPSALLAKAKGAALLVVDELFSRGAEAYTVNASQTIGEIFRVRFEEGRATLMTSNEGPMFGVAFDSRIESRWMDCGRAIDCSGPDLRATDGR
jgi:hypothetical protein